jgi:hypothetical protein
MSQFQQHPDGLVYLRTTAATYVDAAANFVADYKWQLPPLPLGFKERIYEPGVRHALMGNGSVVAGPMPWDFGDKALAAVAAILAAQAKRQPAPISKPRASTPATGVKEF